MRALLCLPLLAACVSGGGPTCPGDWGTPSCQARRVPDRPPVADGVPPASDERRADTIEADLLRDALIAKGYPEDVAGDIARAETRDR